MLFSLYKNIFKLKHNKQVFSRKFTHIICTCSVKNDGKFETFLWYVN